MNDEMLSLLLDLHKNIEQKTYEIVNGLSIDGTITMFDNELVKIADFISEYIGVPEEGICFTEDSIEHEIYFEYLDSCGCISNEIIYDLLWDYSYNRLAKEEVIEIFYKLHETCLELKNKSIKLLH